MKSDWKNRMLHFKHLTPFPSICGFCFLRELNIDKCIWKEFDTGGIYTYIAAEVILESFCALYVNVSHSFSVAEQYLTSWASNAVRFHKLMWIFFMLL